MAFAGMMQIPMDWFATLIQSAYGQARTRPLR